MLRSIHKAESARGVNCPRIHDTEVLLDNVSYSSVINAWPHAKEPSKAEEWLATMLKVEVSANVGHWRKQVFYSRIESFRS